jgi:hypothetical protein
MTRPYRRRPRRTSTATGVAFIIFAICCIGFGLLLFWLLFGEGLFVLLVVAGVMKWFLKLNPPSRNARE